MIQPLYCVWRLCMACFHTLLSTLPARITSQIFSGHSQILTEPAERKEIHVASIDCLTFPRFVRNSTNATLFLIRELQLLREFTLPPAASNFHSTDSFAWIGNSSNWVGAAGGRFLADARERSCLHLSRFSLFRCIQVHKSQITCATWKMPRSCCSNFQLIFSLFAIFLPAMPWKLKEDQSDCPTYSSHYEKVSIRSGSFRERHAHE